jgi:hypothetical protein
MYATHKPVFTCVVEVELLHEFRVVHWDPHGTLTSGAG